MAIRFERPAAEGTGNMVTTTRSSRTRGSSGRPWRHVGVLGFLLVGCESASLTLGDELPVDPAQPYNAVGMMNNGCTAFLIDADHIVAAAHCFVDTNTGQCHQRFPLPAGVLPNELGLRFYPNFHPDRRDDDPARVPRADITRAVVGSRAGENMLRTGMDWGIAKVENWRDTAGLDLTPLALAPASPTVGAQLVNPTDTTAPTTTGIASPGTT